MHPYSENPIRETRGRTRNWRDSLNIFEDSHGPEGKYNPVFKLHFLGGVISQGLVGYITMVSSEFRIFGVLTNLYPGRGSTQALLMTTGGRAESNPVYVYLDISLR